MENSDRVYQAEFTRLPELGKVKAHKDVKRLMEKGSWTRATSAGAT